MALAPGSTLGPYEILEPVGKGGMGEVYRARDTKLERDVAIKVLPEELASDTERLARFEREAKLLASLNHSNIASIYGFESHALVLELVEGPTLAERIAEGPIPIEEAIAIARQIAAALEAGHETGVVHRDLKPANIKLKEDGTVKVLDYGLAKAMESETVSGADSQLSQSPTLTRQGTQVGVILGTAAYMSPEQAKGRRVDRRADIWAFGAVLYEILSGRRAFGGDDVSETLAAVIRGEPDFDALPTGIPPAVGVVLRLCLNKDVTNRFQSIGDVRLALDGAFESAVAESQFVFAKPLFVIAVALAFLIGGVAGWRVLAPDPEPRPMVRFSIRLPAANVFAGLLTQFATLSPDGTSIAYIAGSGLHLRHLNQSTANPIPGTVNARNPFFSADGQWLGFWANAQLQRISVRGGAPLPICDAEPPLGAWWSEDGTIVYAERGVGVLRVRADGGEPEVMISLADEEIGASPQMLPGGDTVLMTLGRSNDWESSRIVAHSISSGETTTILQRGRGARYVSTGHLLYVVNGTLFAAPFDVNELEVRGAPVPVADNVMGSERTSAGHFSVSGAGSLIYVSGDLFFAETTKLAWVDRQGVVSELPLPAREYWKPALSPDATQVAITHRDGVAGDIWVHDLVRGNATRLTFDPASDFWPIWSPDGTHITFGSERSGGFSLYSTPAEGSGEPVRLFAPWTTNSWPGGWSPDGKTLAFSANESNAGIWTLTLGDGNGESTPETFVDTPYGDREPSFSPDGRWIAYESDESGRPEIYVRPYPKAAGQWQVSTDGGSHPQWSREGNELFYRSGDQMIAVDYVIEGDSFVHGRPRVLFHVPTPSSVVTTTYAVTADGQRFLVLIPDDSDAGAQSELNVILNWHEELEHVAPPE